MAKAKKKAGKKSVTVIVKGYRLTVMSWENDLDNPNVVVLEGLSREDTNFYVALCKLMFEDDYSKDEDNPLHNLFQPDKAERKAVWDAVVPVMRRYGKVENEQYADDHAMEFLCELGLSGSEFYTRVCASYKVEHVEADIIIPDVTEAFT